MAFWQSNTEVNSTKICGGEEEWGEEGEEEEEGEGEGKGKGEEGEKEEEEKEEEDGDLDQDAINTIISTFLPNQDVGTTGGNCGTVITTPAANNESGTLIVTPDQPVDQSGTMIITKDNGARRIGNYEPVYEDSSPALRPATKTNKLQNLSIENLYYVLNQYKSDCIRRIWAKNCVESKLRKEYDAFRAQIIDTLRAKGQDVSDDYNVIPELE